MRSASTAAALIRSTVFAVALALLAYLALLAFSPGVRESVPAWLQWFGRPGSWTSIALVTVAVASAAVIIIRPRDVPRPGAPLAVVAGLGLLSLALGLASYWYCYDDQDDPWLFRPLMWTVSLVKGGTGNQSINGQICPSPTPVALEVARLAALTAIFVSVVGVAAALFQSGLDRLRVYFARTVTVIVDMDDDAQSLVSSVARTLDKRSTLAVVSADPQQPCVQNSRRHGARLVAVDFDRPETVTSLSLWPKLDRLYLLSPDPSTNLLRLRLISERLNEVGEKQRLPLIVRIDDPWQAEAWRARHFGGSDTRWAADAVGKYEVTARLLLDRVLSHRVDRILVCGSSRLTLALCSDISQRQLERDYYAAPGEPDLPKLLLVAENSEEYRQDHEHSRARLGLASDSSSLEAVGELPTVSLLASLIAGGDSARTAVILVDADGSTGSMIDPTTGTRLAARFPATPIYAWDSSAEVSDDRLSIVGELRTYRLSMDVPTGHAQDAWERAARLIHDRYAAEAGHGSLATLPWSELSEFYRQSNRRQVRNALWMVEQIGGHTWNVWDGAQDLPVIANLHGLEPLEQLRLMGFDRDAAMAMARAEHEDWCRYYRANGWKYGAERDDTRKIHDKLLDWEAIESDPERLRAALGSLATTVARLRELGYRSRPLSKAPSWKEFRRIGTVLAQRRSEPWTWTTRTGQTMRADAGDWEVRDADGGDPWSVRDDIFRSTYEPIDGQRWRRNGTVTARPARDGEIIHTLEGSVRAAEGDWVVQGDQGEQWPVPGDEFAKRYEDQLSG